MPRHPLDDTFDTLEGTDFDDLKFLEEIPDDPTLDTIIKLSLKAYKEQMQDIVMVEPKNRARYLEVAEKFLNQAKDALSKKEQIALAREKLKTPSTSNKKSDSATQPSAPAGGGKTRKELMEERQALKVVK